jgi:hypothetical protein
MAANPYTSAQAPGGITSLIAPDIAVQQQQLARQQQLADMLRQQAMENDGGTQVINGWAVQKSPFEHLAKLGQAYFGKGMQDDIDTKNLQLSKEYASVMADKLNHPPGSTPLPVASADTPTTSAPMSIGPTVDNAARMDAAVASGAPRAAALAQALSGQTAASSAPVQPSSSPAPTNNFDMAHLQYAALLNGLSPQMANAYAKQFEAPDQQRLDSYLGVSAAQRRDLNLAAARKEGTQALIPGQTNVLPDGSRIVAPNFETGMAGGFGPDGAPTVSAIPGAADAKAGMTRAATQAEVQARDAGALPTQVELKTPTNIPGVGMVQPGVYMLTPSQQRSIANGGTDSLYPASPTAGQMPGHPITGLSTDRAISTIRDPQQRSNVVAAIGAGPTVAPMQVQSAADKKGAEGLATYGVDVQKDIDSRLASASQQNMDLQEARDALQRFQSGGGTEFKAKLATIAQGLGFSQGVVDQIGKGDLGAIQQFNASMSRQTLAALKSTLGAGNPIRMAELKQFEASNPHLDTDPRAMAKVFDFQDKLYKDVRTERREFSNFVKGGGAASDFPGYWAEQRSKLGFTNPTGTSQPTNAVKPTITLDDIAAEIQRRKTQGAK